MTDNVIEVHHVSKRYHVSQLRANSRRRALPAIDDVRRWFSERGKPKEDRWIWALRDVSLAVPRGESWGLIGRNGSGKTTLLKVIGGVTQPTSGAYTRHGTLSSMLGASTGFNPELSGRENVYLSAAILGVPQRQVDATFDRIADFAGITRMIDTPVKRYSSGMSVRLAFSIAVNLEPEILLVDEILTVGDYEFRLKALERIKQLRAVNNCTVVLVSHNLSIVKAFCERAIWLDRGEVRAVGKVDDVIRDYLREMQSTDGEPSVDGTGLRHEGSGDVRVTSLRVLDASNLESATIIHGDPLTLELAYDAAEPVQAPVFSVSLVRVQDNIVATRLYSGQSPLHIGQLHGRGAVEIRLPHLWLMPGEYRLSVTVAGGDTIYDQVEGFPILHVAQPLTMADPRASFDASDMVTFVPAEWHLQPATSHEPT